MASTLGGWYLNGSTLEYRLLKSGSDTELSTTVIAKITGLGNYLKKVDNDATKIQIKVKNDSGTAEWTDLDDEKHVSITAEEKDVTSGTTTKKEYEGTITIGDVVLDSIPSTITLANSNGGKFTLDLQNEATHKVSIAGAEDFEYDKNGKLTVKADLTAGFKLSGNTATYYAAKSNQTLATVTGLRTNVEAKYQVYDASDNPTGTARLTPAKETRTGTITLSKIAIGGAADGTDTTSEGSVLGTSNISITTADVAKTQGINYYLALDDDKKGLGYAQQDLDKYEPAARWTYSGTTAKYNIESPTGYELTDANGGTEITAEKPATKIKVTAKKTTNVVTVSGLAKDLDVSEDGKKIGTYTFSTAGTAAFKEGLTVNEIAETDHPTKSGNTTTKGKVTVNIKDNNVITNTTVSLSSSSYTPKFGTVNNVLKEEDIKDIWEINGTTATLKRVRRAWYKPDKADGTATKLTYGGQTTLYTFLTITGLSAEGLDAAEKTTTASDNYEPAVITAIDGLTVDTSKLDTLVDPGTDNNGLKKYTKKTGTVADLELEISTALLDTNTAKIGNSDKFKIKLADNVAAPTFSGTQWNVESNGTKAILKGDIKEGYVVKADGKSVTYTKAGDNQTLATITGLKKGTKLTVDDSDARTVGFGGGSSFKQGLSLATNDALSSNRPVDFSTVAGLSDAYNRQSIIVSKNVIDTSKVQINSSFFDLELDNTDNIGGSVPTATTSDQLYWTLGTTAYLKKNASPYYSLATNHLSIDYKTATTSSNKADTITTVKGLNANVTVEDLVVDDTTIKVNANALDNKNVTITNPTNAEKKYTLQLVGGSAPTIESPEWKQTGNTVTYAADVKSGYRTSNDGSAIIYNPTKETTLFTITGLRSGVGTVKDGEGKVTGLSGIVLNENNRTVELSYGVLNNANVTLKSDYGYDLLVNSDIKTVAPGSTASIASWAIDGTTATYKAIIPAYYEYNADKDTLIYHKATDAKEGSKTVTYAKITGLSKGLFVSENGQSIGYYKDDGAFVAGLSAAGTEANLITIKDAGILSTVAAKLDNAAIAAGYSLALDSTLENNIKPKFVDNFSDTDATWTVKGTTAYLLGGVSKGYVTSEDKHSILYYAGNDTAATIATVKNLPSGLTTKKVTDNGGASGLKLSGHKIQVGKDVLATNTKLALTTNIPVGNENYYFALADDVTDYNDAVSSLQKVWTIKDSTATYRGSIGSAYYGVVGSASDSISYNAAGLPDDLKYAELTGLASNLVTVQGGAIKGISVAELGEGSETNHKIELSSNVLKAATVTLTDLNTTDTLTFGLSTAGDYSPKDAAGLRVPSAGNIDLYKGKTSGYTLSGASLIYEPVDPKVSTVLAKITGLASTFKSSGTAVSPSNEKVYETLDGISVDYTNKKVTLSQEVLGSGDVTFSENTAGYEFALDDNVNKYSAGKGWIKGTGTDDGKYVLYAETSQEGFALSENGAKVEKKGGGGTGGTIIGTISGIKKNLTIDNNYQIAGISFGTGDDKTIYLSQNVLDGKDVTITGSGYKLALNSDQDDEAAYVAAPVTTNLWTLNNGTATYEQKTTAGYTNDGDTTIKYTKAQTITTKIDNLSKEFVKVTEEQAGTNKLAFTGAVAAAESGDADNDGNNDGQQAAATVNEAITFDSDNGKFKINYADVLAHKNSSIKVSYTGLTDAEKANYKYALDLESGIAAKSDNPVWVKSNKETTAKLNQTTAAGYTLALDGSKITYSSDPTTKTLATISNLKRDVALKKNGELEGTSTYGLSYANVPASSGDNPGTITVYKGVLDVLSGSNTVKLADSDNFKFEIDGNVPTTTKDGNAFTVSGTKATYKSGKTAYYTYKKNADNTENQKQIAYTPANMSTEVFTIEGLKSGTKANADGSITGITVDGNEVTVSQAVLDKSKVTLTNSGDNTKRLKLGIGVPDYSVQDESSDWKDQTEWISSGSTYTYKTYDKTSYELDKTSEKTITYHGETSGTEHAKITGLNSGLTISNVYAPNDPDHPELGGTITLSDNELNKAKVTLTTKGDTKIKLALDSTDATLEAKATPDSSWTTSGTKATLGGTLSKGYTVSEDEMSITYNSAKKSQTFATITGIKSGAKIKAEDFIKDATTGVTTVTLGADQVGTSDIKITGDGYKLAVDDDIKSTTDTPQWIKTAGNNKATYTETTYNGFKVESSGKTLKYYKNTTNVDLITINGLKSDLVADSGEIEGVTFGDGDNDKVITLSAAALAKSNVSLTSKEGDYSLAIEEDNISKLEPHGTAEDKKTYLTFKDGTLSRVTGITESWTRESPTLIKYTAPKIDTLVTISGLNKAATFTENLADPTSNTIAGVTLDGDTFKLSKTALATLTDGKSVTLTNKTVNGTASTFKLALDDSATGDEAVSAPAAGDYELALSGTTAYLKATTTEGYEVTGDNKITYKAKKQDETLATITGLPSGCKLEQDGEGKNIITLNGERVLYYSKGDGKNKVCLDNNFFNNYKTNYNKAMTLKITDNKIGFGATFTGVSGLGGVSGAPYNFGTFSNGTMTYKSTSEAGWITSDTSYQYKTAETKTVATVSGLNPTVTSTGQENEIDVDINSNKVIVGPNALNNKKVTISVPNGSSDKYTLAIEDDVYADGQEEDKWKNQVEWVMSNGTASYKLYDKGHYKVNGTSTAIDYTAANAGTTYASITGLTKTATIDSNDVSAEGVITLTSADLGTSTVKLSIAGANKVTVADSLSSVERSGLAGGKTNVGQAVSLASSFTLDLADGVNESEIQHAVWDTTGTTAKLVGTVTKGYVLSTDKKSVTYQAADQDGKEIAKITGLRSGAEVTANDVSKDTNDKRINYVKLDGYDLGTGNVAIMGAGYKLALDSSKVILSSVDGAGVTGGWKEQTDWTASNGTFTYKLYNKANWKVDENTGTSVKYTAAKDVTNGTKLTITGLNPDVITQDVDRYISSNTADNIVKIDDNNNQVTLGAKALNRKTITLSDKSGDGYTLANIDGNKSTASNLTGVVSGSKVTVRGTQSQGYLLSNDSQKLTYYAKATTQDVAVINGLITTTYAASLKGSGALNLEFRADTNTFTLKDEQLSNSVTVSGSARFSFADDYINSSITGSGNADYIAVAGTGLSINGGNGNDYIDLNSTSGNTVIYGGGNDVIANFGTSNTFKVTNLASGTNLVFLEDNNGDAILKVNSNKVRFKGLGNGADFSILDKNGAEVTHGSGGNGDVLADDNYSTTPQLSSIVNNSSGYMTTDDLTATDATSLTKQNTAIAYSGKK